jgi:hypothetical protein
VCPIIYDLISLSFISLSLVIRIAVQKHRKNEVRQAKPAGPRADAPEVKGIGLASPSPGELHSKEEWRMLIYEEL